MANITELSFEDLQSIRQWNRSSLAAVNRRVHDIFADRVIQDPSAEAICAHDGNFSYSELDDASTRLAQHLVRMYRIVPEQFIALAFDKSAWNVVAMLGVLKAGAAFIPLDPNAPFARLQSLCQRTNSPLLLCSSSRAEDFSGIAPCVLGVDGSLLAKLPSTRTIDQASECDFTNAAYLIFTSGSTGEPKGTIIEHGALATSVNNHGPRMYMDSSSRVLQFAAHTFDASIQEILTTLLLGGTVCIIDEHSRLNSIAKAINDLRVNWACLTPSVVNFISPHDVPGLRTLILVGEPMNQTHLATWTPCTRLINGYGPTECTIAAVANTSITTDTHPLDIGYPIGVHCWVVQSDNHNKLVPVGSEGELLIQGPTLARGYLNDAAKTADSFIESPQWTKEVFEVVCTDRMYKTGDIVRQNADGSLRFIGRKDNQVKVHGQRVELGEIEANLNNDPAVNQCLVLLPKAGLFKGRLVAFVSTHSHGITREVIEPFTTPREYQEIHSIAAYLTTRLPSYMIPFIIGVAAIPRQTSGKLDRKLAVTWLETMSEDVYQQLLTAMQLQDDSTGVTTKPASEVEDLLLNIWSRVLNLNPRKVDLNRPFLSLGGDSISAMQVIGHCSKNNLALSVQDILKAKSVTELASRAKPMSSPASYAEVMDQDFELSPIQRLFFSLPNQGVAHFNQSFFLRVTREISLADLRSAVEAIVQRHSMLRARFTGNPVMQHITDDVAGSYRLKSHSVTTLELATPAISDSQTTLDPFHGPLFAVDLFDVANGDQLLFMVGHHLVIDLVSWRVILDEVEELLSNPSRDWVIDRPFPFQTWCNLQMNHAQSFAPEKCLPSIDIPPGDFKFWGMDNEPNTYGNVSVEGFEVDADVTSQLLTNCHSAFRTEQIDILLSALIYSFSGAFQNRTVPVYTEGHGREPSGMDVNLSKTVGWFTTLYPVHVPASACRDPSITVKYVKDFRCRVPDNGRPYFASRCLTEAGKKHFNHQWPFEITFNYLGQYQQLEREGALLTPVESMAGEARGSGGVSDVGHDTPRFGLFEISAVIVQGKLRFSFTFNRKIKHRDRISKWVTGCQEAIRLIVKRLSQMAPQPTLGDFPLLSLTYESLEKVIGETLPSLGIPDYNNIESIYPCSSIQEGLLISQSRNASSYEDHVIYEVKSRTGLVPEITQLVEAWKMVVQRHPTLRTVFFDHVGDDDRIYDQVVLKHVTSDVSVLNCEDEKDALERLNVTPQRRQNNRNYPPHQFTICQTSDSKIFCKVEISHTIIDGESMSIVFRDLALAYENRLDVGTGPLYSDYVAYLQSLPISKGIDYWISYLNNVEPSNFPILNDGVPASKALHSIKLDFSTSEFFSLQRFCEMNGFTLSNVFHTAWALILRLYTGSEENCFGYLSSNRDASLENAKDAVGPYINMLVCRLKIDASTKLSDIIRQVQNDYVESLPYKHTSLAEVQHALKLSSTPLFNTSLSYRKLPSESDDENTSVSFTQCCPTYDPTEYPLSINIESSEDSAAIDLDYWTDHISDGQAANIGRTFLHAVQNILEKSECAVGQLESLSSHDHQQIMTWNNTIPKTINECVHTVIQKQARMQPDGPAVHGWDGNFTYSELDEVSSKLATYLAELGVGPERYVPVCFEKSSWTIVAMIAILKAGGGVVPLDPKHPRAALELRIQDTKAEVVLAAPHLAHLFGDFVRHVVIVSPEFTNTLPDDVDDVQCTSVQPTDPCFIIYTSGSTGRPKGVVLEHRNLVTSGDAHGTLYRHGPGSRVLQFSAYTFDNSLEDIFTTLMLGGCVCVPSESDRYGNLAGAINAMAVNFMSLTPTVASLLHPSQVPTIKGVSLGGEPLTKENVEVWADTVRLQGGYGPSECSINAMWRELDRNSEPTNLGRSIGSVSWIVDPSDYNVLLPIGCAGELLIEGPIVARGYLNDREKTAAAFIFDPTWASGGNRRMYRTGDLVRYNSDGTVTYLGRRDTQVKLNGQRLEIGEIEHHVKANLPSGTRSAVELVKSENGAKFLAVFFSPPTTVSATQSDVELLAMDEPLQLIARNLEAALSKTLPKYMVPTLYVSVTSIPTTASEKVDRRKLRTLCESLSDSQASQYRLAKQSTRQLSSEMEKKLGHLWESVLKLRQGSVRADDDFFEVGGDSIGAMRLMTAARQQGISISVTSIFRKSTLSDLAKEIEQDIGSIPVSEIEEPVIADPEPFSLAKTSASMFKTIKTIAEICQIDPESIQDIYHASPLQEGLISLALKDPGAYVAQNIYQLPADIDLARFKEAWARVFAGESILRSRIVHTNKDGFLQVVVEESPIWNDFSSIEDLPSSSRLLPAYNGGSLSTYSIVGATTSNVKFVWTAHHAIYDGWCVSSIFERVEAYYQSEPMSSMPQGVPFSRFVKYLSGINQNDSDAFWRSKLSGTSATQWPMLPHPAYQVQATSVLKHMSAIARTSGSRITLPSIIRAAWALTLSVYSGNSEDVVFGEILTGRDIPIPGIVDMIGPTLTTVPTRISIEGTANLSKFLQNIQIQSAEVVPFQHAGLQRIKQLNEDTAIACGFQNILVINGDSEPPPLSSLFELLNASTAGTNFSSYPLAIVCDVEGRTLNVEIHYDPDVVNAWQVEKLVNQFDYFFQRLDSRSVNKETLDQIQILNPTDEAEIQSWNSEPLKRVEKCMHHIFESQVQLQPADKIAVDSHDAKFTYTELERLSTRLAQYIIEQNINASIIPFCFEKSAWAIVSMLAILKAGKAFVPLDSASPISRLRDIIGDIKADHILCSAKHRDLCEKLTNTLVVDRSMAEALSPGQINLSACSSDSPAYVIFTSGSTGKPKGTVIDHSTFCTSATAHGPTLQLGPESRALQLSSYTFDVSVMEIFTTLILGGTVCVPDDETRMNNISKFIAEKRVTWTALTPTFAQMINPLVATSLRTMCLGGEKMSQHDIATWCDRLNLINAYGPSECAITTTARINVTTTTDPTNIGFATGSRTWIVDPQNHNRLAPIGSIGELVIEGPLARGYLNDEVKTAEAFIENPDWALSGNTATTICRRFYKTGDLVKYVEDGSMIFCRRKDTQTKIHGQRIEVGEIEYNLKEHAAIRHVLAIVPSSGHCSSRLVAVLSLRDIKSSDPEINFSIVDNHISAPYLAKIREHLCDRLPAYMIPSHWIVLHQLPLLPSGKLDRRQMTKWIEELDDEAYRKICAVDNEEVDEPSTDIETRLQKIWGEILNLPPNKISLHTSFIHLGGDSISAMQVMSRCRSEGMGITVHDILQSKSISQLALCVSLPEERTIVDEKVDTPFDLSPIQKLYFEAVGGQKMHFNQSTILRFSKRVEQASVVRAVEALVRAHSMLRSRFSKNELGVWQQRVIPLGSNACRIRCRLTTPNSLEKLVRESQESLDVENGPTFAAELFDLGDVQVLSLVAHHLVIDVVSWRIILQDLEEMLKSKKFEVPVSLPFQTWSYLQVEQAQKSASTAGSLLEDVPIAEFDYWGMREKSNVYADVVTESFEIGQEVSSNILGSSQNALDTEAVDVFIASALYALQKSFSDRPQIPAIYNEGHGREIWDDSSLDLSRTVGWFTTICPLYLPSTASKNVDLIDIIRWIKDLRSRIPAKGREYFDFRYLTDAGREMYGSHWPMEITFNYLGKLQQLERQDSLLQPFEPLSSGELDIGLNMPRFSLIDISVSAKNGKIQFSVSYNKQMKHQTKIRRFVQECQTTLEEAANRLLQLKPERTLSNFPLLPLSFDGVKRLEQKLPILGVSSLDDIEDAYPCSPMQQGLLLSQAKNPDFYAYSSVFKIRSSKLAPVNVRCLIQAWQDIIRRHATLRTVFIDGVCRDGELGQIILREYEPNVVQLRCEDKDALKVLSQLPPPEFAMPQPPHRLTICETNTGRVYGRLEMSHAVSDGTSLPILFEDLSEAYKCRVSDDHHVWAGSAPLYSHYISHITQNSDTGMKYWKSYLSGIEPCRFPPVNDGVKAETHHLTHSIELQDITTLRSFCSEQGVTISNALQLVWGLVLKLYTGSDEICFGYLTSGRDAPIPDLQDRAVGAFINMLICRMDFTSTPKLSDLLKRIQSDYSNSIEHQSCSLGDVQHELQLSGTSLFNTAFTYQNRSNIEKKSSVLEFDILDTHDPSEYDIGVNVEAWESKIEISFSYWTHCVSAPQAVNMAHTFEHLVNAVASASTDQPISDLNLFSTHSHNQIMTWNKGLPQPIEKRVQDLIHEQQLSQPLDTQAVCSWDVNLTYTELDELTTTLAFHLVELGVGPEVCVPICFGKSTWAVVAILAIFKAGGAFVPVDASYPQSRLKHIIDDVKATLVLCSQQYQAKFQDLVKTPFVVDSASVNALPTELDSSKLPLVTPKNAAIILYTSGTTGQPKGTITEHGSFCTGAVNFARGVHLTSKSRALQFASLTFDAAIMEIVTTLIVGGCVCIPSDFERFNDIPGAVKRMNVNWMFSTPAMASTLIPKTLPSLGTLAMGGEAISATDVAKWQGKLCLICAYGPSEATVISTTNVLLDDDGNLAKTGMDNIGKAVAGRIWVVDSKNDDKLMPIGAVGELVVESRGVARGYLHNPEKTAAAFIASPSWLKSVEPRERLYKTGDLVRYNSDGSVNFVARKDTQIKLNGQRIEISEIEFHVKANLPADTDAAVEMVTRGKSKAIAVFFCPKLAKASQEILLPMSEDARSLSRNLDTSLAGTLPSYMIPTLFIPVTNLPIKISSGKLDRALLRDLVRDMPAEAVAGYRLSSNVNKRNPKTDMEKKLQKLWETVLEVKTSGSVGAEDSFFRLGGDSITAMRLVVAARAQGIQLDVVSIFRSPKLSDLAALCTANDSKDLIQAAPQPFSLVAKDSVDELLDEIAEECKVSKNIIIDAYPCSPLQEALITLSTKQVGAYVTTHVFRLAQNTDLQLFKSAWLRVIEVVDVLRIRIVHLKSSQFVQAVFANPKINWEMANTVDEAREKGENLPSSNGGALTRYALVNSDDPYNRYFVWSIHHSLYDGWSLPAVLRLVETAYLDALAPLASSCYSSFIQYLTHIDQGRSDEFWKSKLDGASPIQFPQGQITDVDHTREIELAHHSVTLTRNTSKTGVTVTSIIRGAWSLVVAAHSGSNDVIFGEVLAGRDISVTGIQDIMGPTIAIIPNRTLINGDATIEDFLTQVQKAATDTIPFQHAGLQRIKTLGSEAAASCDFQNLLVIQPADGEEAEAGMWTQHNDGFVQSNFSTYPLMIECHAGSGNVKVTAYYDKTVISRWMVDRILFQLDSVMKQLTSAPISGSALKIRDIQACSPQDIDQIRSWNAAQPELTDRCLHAAFEQNALSQPNATAVCAWDGELTYKELKDHSTKLAHHLINLGVGPEIFVPICMDKSVWVVVAILGVLMAGGAYVPLDPASPLSRHEIIVKDTKATVVLCSEKYGTRFSQTVKTSLVIDRATIANLENSAKRVSYQVTSSNAAYVIYTSGSTGIPKGVVIEHRAISSSIWSWRKKIPITPKSRMFHFGSLAFDASLLEIFGALTHGACVCIPSEESRLSNLAESINVFKATITFITPSLANIIEPTDVPSLKVMICGGEALGPEVVDRWASKVNLIGGYGPTECAVFSTENSRLGVLRNPLNIGYAFLASRTWVVDPGNHNQLMPLGAVGELLIEGTNLSRGYLNNPQKTAEVFITNPTWSKSFPGADQTATTIPRYYKTGDLVKYDTDGSVIYIGRKDNQVKVRGQRIELGEIEFTLLKHSAVRSGLVMVPKSGPFKKRLVAIVSLNEFKPRTVEGQTCTLLQNESDLTKAVSLCAEIKDHVSESLPVYMVPDSWLPVEAIPLTSSGKAERSNIQRWLETLDQETYNRLMASSAESSTDDDLSETEKLLQATIARVLNIHITEVRMKSSFLGLGGDSITAMQLLALCRKDSIQLTLPEVLRSKSIRQLASLSRHAGEVTYADEKLDYDFDLSPIQQMYFKAQQNPEQRRGKRFNQSFLLKISKPAPVQQLQEAIKQIVHHHSMLRARFSKNSSGEWRQRIPKEVEDSYRFCNYDVDYEDDIPEFIDISQNSLNIQRGPVFSVDVFNMNDEQIVFLVGHHAVVDMVSWRIILQDLEDILIFGKLTSKKPLSFQTWSSMQTEESQKTPTGGLKSLLPFKVPSPNISYWNMSGKPNTYGDTTTHNFVLDPSTTTAIFGESNIALQTEPLDLFISSITHSFGRVFQDRRAPTIFNESHGREAWDPSIDLARTVGWFTSLCPLHVDVSPAEDDVLNTLKKIKDIRSRIPGSGRPYFAYRYLNGKMKQQSDDQSEQLEIMFNYLGKTQQLERDDSLLRQWQCPISKEDENLLSDVGPRTTRLALIEISAVVIDEKLQFSFVFNSNMNYQQKLQNWISELKGTLEEVVRKISSLKNQRVLTLSDFPLLPLTYAGLQKLSREVLPAVGIKPEDVEDIYPCAPMQEGMLLGQLRDPQFYQFHTAFEVKPASGGRVDAQRLADAWRYVVNRHAALRTIFVDSVYRGDVFNQVVVKRVDREGTIVMCKGSDVMKKVEGFTTSDLGDRPHLPHQFTVFQTPQGRVYAKLEMNHAIMDASSLPILFHDLVAGYEGKTTTTPAPLYRSYIEYLKKQPPGVDTQFWKTYLSGIRACNFPSLNPKSTNHKELGSTQLNFDHFPELQAWCKARKLTLPNVMKAAWTLCLRHYTNSEDVCFGYLASGRDLPVEGIQETVGPLINMLVCRVNFAQTSSLEDVVQKVQDDYFHGLDHQHTSLAQIQHELNLSGASLFNTAVSIQGGDAAAGDQQSSISFRPIAADDPTEYALTISIGVVPGNEGAVLRFKPECLSREQAESLLRGLGRVLDAIITSPHQAFAHKKFFQEVNPDIPSQLIPMDQTTHIRTIVKECVSEIVAQMLNSGVLTAGNAPIVDTVSDLVNRRISQPGRPTTPLVEHRETILKVPTAQAPVSTPNTTESEDSFNDMRPRLLALWSEHLQVPSSSIANEDSFFQLGGDSIVAMRMVGAAREEELSLTVADVFRCPVFEEMLDVISLPKNTKPTNTANQATKRNTTPPAIILPSRPTEQLIRRGSSNSPHSPVRKRPQAVRRSSRRSDSNITAEVRHRRRSMYEEFSLIQEPNVEMFLQDNVCPKVGLFKGGIIDVLPATDFQALSITGSLLESRWMLNYFFLDGRGILDLKRLRAAVLQVADAFDILRTVFIPYNGQFFQVVLRKLQPKFDVETVDNLDEFTGVLRQRDCDYGPRPGQNYLQFTVAKVKNTDKHRIFIRISHAQYDGVCLPHILNALRMAFQGESIPPSPSFTAYAREALGKTTNDHYRYWKELLRGSKMTDIVSRRGPSYGRGSDAPTMLRRKVRMASLAAHGITSASIIKAAWSLILAQMTSESDVVFGNVISGRNVDVPELHSIVGPCVNTVPVRVPFQAGWTAIDLLRHIQTQQVNNMPYESMGFREIIKSCTDWPDWTNFTTVCQHQNIETKPTMQIGNVLYEFGAVGSQEDFADLSVLSMPQENGIDTEICFMFSLSNIGMSKAAMKSIFDDLCNTAEDFSRNPNKPLPAPTEIKSMPRQTPSPRGVHQTSGMSMSLSPDPRNQKDLLQYSNLLIRCWRQVLGDASLKIGPETSFFDLGGDLIGLSQVLALLEHDGFKLRLEDLMRFPLIAEQVVLMERFAKTEEEEDFGRRGEGVREGHEEESLDSAKRKKGVKKVLGLARSMLSSKSKSTRHVDVIRE